ncbi:MAG: oligoendopeptidase F, partial [Clostridia bacterium]|nr:oligoendopeptidase F [Clostridia bacterium]
MAIELKTRSEIDPKFQWKLTDIFADEEAWEQELNEVSALVKELPALSGTLGNGVESVRSAFEKIFGVSERVELVYVYSFL